MLKKIYLDFDGCIVNSIAAIVSLYNEDFCYYKDYHPVNWWDVENWGFSECNCASEEYINSYFNQKRFFDRLEYMPWAKEVISILQKFYDITVVSHGYSPNLKLKEEWIRKNLPGVKFIGVNLKNHKDKSCVDMTGVAFIDDNSLNLQTCNARYKFRFGDEYEWNKDWRGKCLYNWTDIYNTFIGGGNTRS